MEKSAPSHPSSSNRTKFIVGGILIAAAVIYLIVTSTKASAQYYLTVEELNARKSEVMGRHLKVSGAVLGETILYNPQTLALEFTIVHIPGKNKEIKELGGLAQVLHDATINPDLPRLKVIYTGIKPDLLTNEAEAIITGKINAEGVFEANELLLKCPSRYEEAIPNQSNSNDK